MKLSTVLPLACAVFVSAFAVAEKPEWAGEGKPTQEQKDAHTDQMKAKGDRDEAGESEREAAKDKHREAREDARESEREAREKANDKAREQAEKRDRQEREEADERAEKAGGDAAGGGKPKETERGSGPGADVMEQPGQGERKGVENASDKGKEQRQNSPWWKFWD